MDKNPRIEVTILRISRRPKDTQSCFVASASYKPTSLTIEILKTAKSKQNCFARTRLHETRSELKPF